VTVQGGLVEKGEERRHPKKHIFAPRDGILKGSETRKFRLEHTLPEGEKT